MTEQDYWISKLNLEQTFLSQQQEQIMTNLLLEQDMKIFSMLNPDVSIDGNQHCVLYGENLQEGVAGFGDTLILAIRDFNAAFYKSIS